MKVRLAYDADCRRKRGVALALQQEAAELEAAGHEVEIELWDEADGKGLDDLLAARKTPSVVEGEAARAAIAAIVKEALQRDPPPDHLNGASGGNGNGPPNPLGEPGVDVAHERPLHTTDVGNALRLVRRFGAVLRHCHAWGRWLLWDGKRWKVDESGGIVRLAIETARGIFTEAGASGDTDEQKRLVAWAFKSEASERINAMIGLARNLPGVPIRPDDLDADPELLNCENGTIDLRNGELVPHRRENLITKLCRAGYHPDAPAPLWETTLEKVLPDVDTRAFVKRAAGYSITGSTGEEALFLPYGSGRNGKSKVLGAIEWVLGDYATSTRPETLLSKRGDTIPNDVAALAGARFVVTSETEDGKRLDVSLVKLLTGGDTMTARFMRAEYFNFKPRFKVWFAVNHRPVIRDNTESIWERVKLIPFTVYIPPEERDKNLDVKLRAEADGILRWLVEGCLSWRDKGGLADPEAVKAAVASYRADMDVLAGFFEDRCVLGKDRYATAAALYTAYEEWCGKNHEQAVPKRTFGRLLLDRGLVGRKGTGGQREWTGIGLLVAQPAAAESTPADQAPDSCATPEGDSGATLGTSGASGTGSPLNSSSAYMREINRKVTPLAPLVPLDLESDPGIDETDAPPEPAGECEACAGTHPTELCPVSLGEDPGRYTRR